MAYPRALEPESDDLADVVRQSRVLEDAETMVLTRQCKRLRFHHLRRAERIWRSAPQA